MPEVIVELFWRWFLIGALAFGGGQAALSLVELDPTPDERHRVFGALAAALVPERVLIVADHNRPRRMVDALRAIVARPLVPGSTPSERWQRLARPTAREVQAAGFRVERLRLVAGERVQIVVSRRVSATPT